MPRTNQDWAELGCQMMDARRFSEAIEYFRRLHVTNGHLAGDSPRDAMELLRAISESRPNWSAGQFSLGGTYEYLGDFEHARLHLENALRIDPSKLAGVEALRARMLFLEGKLPEAVDSADRALAANPDSYVALLVRGQACSKLYRTVESVASLRRSIELLPDRSIHASVLFQMNYLEETTPEALYAAACRWNSLYSAPLAAQTQTHANSPDPDRRLKIGYVSPDLCQHPVMKFVPPLLERHDRSRFEVFVYAVGEKSDQLSEHVRGLVENYTAIRGYREVAERVRRDGIDILVDLAGHTMGPELLAFALRPAPVQVSWIGYVGTTGMPEIDYFLGDQHIPCPGTEGCFSETVVRLPRSLGCYRPFGEIPVTAPPCLETGYVSFGCFNNAKKVNRQVVKLWASILHLAPNSKLLLKYHDSDVWQNALREWFQEDGIASERILCEGPSSPEDYLAAYNRIDIVLDPFPYNGGTTTLDALWMGVPVVTLAGRLAVQCVGASILSGAGLADFVARTPEQYLTTALYLAAVVPKRPELRWDIRKSLMASPWMDETGVVREVENAYRDVWRTWCKSRNS